MRDMLYDIQMHCPQQIEYMLAAEQQGNLVGFEKALGTLKEVLHDNGFIQDVRDYEKQKDKQVEEARQQFIETIAKAVGTKDFDEVLVALNTAPGVLESRVNAVLGEYMDLVKTYVLGYMPQVDIKGYE